MVIATKIVRRQLGLSVVMLLATSAAALKAKLTEKTRWRPMRMVRRKFPDGSEALASMPRRAAAPVAGEEATSEYCRAIDKVSAVFGAQRRANTTADEHRMYTRMFEGWLVAEGFGSYFVVEHDEDGLRGVSGMKVSARRNASDKIKVRGEPACHMHGWRWMTVPVCVHVLRITCSAPPPLLAAPCTTQSALAAS